MHAREVPFKNNLKVLSSYFFQRHRLAVLSDSSALPPKCSD